MADGTLTRMDHYEQAAVMAKAIIKAALTHPSIPVGTLIEVNVPIEGARGLVHKEIAFHAPDEESKRTTNQGDGDNG